MYIYIYNPLQYPKVFKNLNYPKLSEISKIIWIILITCNYLNSLIFDHFFIEPDILSN